MGLERCHCRYLISVGLGCEPHVQKASDRIKIA
jgi:hypothetical protein